MVKQNLDIGGSMDFWKNFNIFKFYCSKLRQPFSYNQDCDLLQFVIVCALLKHRTFFYHVPYFINLCARVTLADFILDKIISRTLVERIIHVVWCEVAGRLFIHRLNQPYSPIQMLIYMYKALRSWLYHRPKIKM